MTAKTATAYQTGVELLDALDDWDLHMRSLNRSPHTRTTYAEAVKQLDAYQRSRGGSTTVDEITPEDLKSFLADLLERYSAGTTVTRWGGLLAFFKWATGDGFCATNPMNGIDRPTKPEVVIPILSSEDIRTLLATCGTDFTGLRDRALILFLLSTGCRRSEAAGLTIDDVRIQHQVAKVMGKGSRERIVYFEDQAALAMRRYLRARQRHPAAVKTNRLWIGQQGALTGNGIRQILERKGKATGVMGTNPHAWRHAWAHRWYAAGGSEAALMVAGGWKNSNMPRRYAEAMAAERARAEHATLDLLGDL